MGYGDGGISIIDADTHKQLGDTKLPAHPESFLIDKKLKWLFVNLPDAHMVGVVDLTQFKLISKCVRNTSIANFPMVLDAINHRIFIGYRHPAKLLVLDGNTGKEISLSTMVGDADDLYYVEQTAEVFISGRDGYINIFHHLASRSCKQIANIPIGSGARTSILVPKLKLLYWPHLLNLVKLRASWFIK